MDPLMQPGQLMDNGERTRWKLRAAFKLTIQWHFPSHGRVELEVELISASSLPTVALRCQR